VKTQTSYPEYLRFKVAYNTTIQEFGVYYERLLQITMAAFTT